MRGEKWGVFLFQMIFERILSFYFFFHFIFSHFSCIFSSFLFLFHVCPIFLRVARAILPSTQMNSNCFSCLNLLEKNFTTWINSKTLNKNLNLPKLQNKPPMPPPNYNSFIKELPTRNRIFLTVSSAYIMMTQDIHDAITNTPSCAPVSSTPYPTFLLSFSSLKPTLT